MSRYLTQPPRLDSNAVVIQMTAKSICPQRENRKTIQLLARDVKVFLTTDIISHKWCGHLVTDRFCSFAKQIPQQTSRQNQVKNCIMHALSLCKCHTDSAQTLLVSMSRLLTRYSFFDIVVAAVFPEIRLFYTTDGLLQSSIIRLRTCADKFYFPKLVDM